jgi:CelD/BcsL family acetyltransferase involved in cellulose biosynthesis
MTRALLVTVEALAAIASDWDRLAVICEEPMATPAWMLGWLRHVAPPEARPRVVVVRDGERLIGLAPFYVLPGRPVHYRVMADDFSSRVALLAAPGQERAAARAVAEALTAADPAPAVIDLSPLSASSPWPAALRETWPGRMRPVQYRLRSEDAVTSLLEGTFEDWLDRRGKEFRRTVGKRLRRFERDGGQMRLSTAATVEADIATFIRLHELRWRSKGESRLLALGERLPLLLGEMAAGLVDDARFRLWVVDVAGTPICADFSLVAGGEIVGVNTGWDERFKTLAPAQIVTAHKIEDACARGEKRLDLGWGLIEYKRAFAEGTDRIEWTALVPPGRAMARGLAAVAPTAFKRSLRNSLGDQRVDRLKAVVKRGGA